MAIWFLYQNENIQEVEAELGGVGNPKSALVTWLSVQTAENYENRTGHVPTAGTTVNENGPRP